MKSICIITDSTIQFTQPSFPGRNLVKTIPFYINAQADQKFTKAQELPNQSSISQGPFLVIPDENELIQLIINPDSNHPYDQIIAILSSSFLSPITSRMQNLAQNWIGKCQLQVIDSLTTSVGLGILVQNAAEAVAQGASLETTEQIVRSQIPHIYSILCTPNLFYLNHSGLIDPAQATVGEMLSILPVYVIEEGKLSPLEKVKNFRQVGDLFQEFMDEFDHLKQIAYLQGVNANPQIGRLLKEHASATQPKVPFTEHHINLSLAALLGPQTSAVTVVETA